MCGRPLPGLGSHKHRSCIRYLDSSAHPVCRTGLVVTIVDRPSILSAVEALQLCLYVAGDVYRCACVVQTGSAPECLLPHICQQHSNVQVRLCLMLHLASASYQPAVHTFGVVSCCLCSVQQCSMGDRWGGLLASGSGAHCAGCIWENAATAKEDEAADCAAPASGCEFMWDWSLPGLSLRGPDSNASAQPAALKLGPECRIDDVQ